MIVRNFILWAQKAPAVTRADGAAAFAKAYLYGGISPDQRDEAEQAMYGLLDDPSPRVRRALAETLACVEDAPPGVIFALACDQSDVAAPVLTLSPLLSDAQLIDCAAMGDRDAQAAIAVRRDLSPAVCAALAEIGAREALIALAVNEDANPPDFALRRMIERFGADGELREALLGRQWLPAAARAALAGAAASALAGYAVERNFLSPARAARLEKESRDRASLIVAAGCAGFSVETAALAAYLRVSGQLTAGLALRALLCGQSGLFEATLVELTGLSPRRVAGLIADPASDAFAALFAKAGMPPSLRPAFVAALGALQRNPAQAGDGALRLELTQQVRRACEAERNDELAPLISLLRRFELEAAREKGRSRLDDARRDRLAQEVTMQEATKQEAPAPRLEAPVARAETAQAPVVPAPAASYEVDLAALERELIAA
jgi:uncharacterized protein (DUF2336 family)